MRDVSDQRQKRARGLGHDGAVDAQLAADVVEPGVHRPHLFALISHATDPTPLTMVAACELVENMLGQGHKDIEPLLDTSERTRQVHNERRMRRGRNARQTTAENRHRRMFSPRGPQGMHDPGKFQFQERPGALGGAVPGPDPGPARRHNESRACGKRLLERASHACGAIGNHASRGHHIPRCAQPLNRAGPTRVGIVTRGSAVRNRDNGCGGKRTVRHEFIVCEAIKNCAATPLSDVPAP